jgi:LEA14-like dessication related protein
MENKMTLAILNQDKKKNTTLYAMLGFSAIFGGMYAYYLKNLELLENFEYQILSFQILGSNVSTIRFKVVIDIVNESDVSVTISNYKFDVYLNGRKVGNIKNARANQVLKGGGDTSRFSMEGSIETLSLIGTGLASLLLQNSKDVTVRLDGSYGLKKGLIKLKNLPMDESFIV